MSKAEPTSAECWNYLVSLFDDHAVAIGPDESGDRLQVVISLDGTTTITSTCLTDAMDTVIGRLSDDDRENFSE